MLAHLRLRRPSPAMVVALIALFVALGGGAYAAVALKRNSVSSKHIRNGQVKKPDLGRSSVDSSKVANGALQAEDFAPGQIPAGERGPQGLAGTNGTNGTNGANGLNGAALAAQARCDGCPRSSGPTTVPVNVPLSNGEWTQDGNEANVFFIEATWTTAAASCSDTDSPTGGVLRIFLDGDQIAQFSRDKGGTMETERPLQGIPQYFFAPGGADPRELTATITDDCSGAENATVQDLKVDVVSLLG
jgi:hypothetical protein